MQKFFQEKKITLTNDAGEKLTFFMRPLKIKELNIINRISILSEKKDADEFTTPMLLGLVIGTLSIGGENVPMRFTEKLIDIFLEFNFPGILQKEYDKVITPVKTKEEDLAYYIDFLVHQGYGLSDLMDCTINQFNELVVKAGERLNPKKKVLNPLEAFRRLGIPIRKRGSNGR